MLRWHNAIYPQFASRREEWAVVELFAHAGTIGVIGFLTVGTPVIVMTVLGRRNKKRRLENARLAQRERQGADS